MSITRRTFLHATASATALSCVRADDNQPRQEVKGELGITTGSFMRHLTIEPQRGKQRLLDLPKIMRDELDLRVLDLMTATLASFEPSYIDQLRTRAEKAKLIITNLKMNQKGIDMASADPAKREHALKTYKKTIDVAHRLGCRWVRPLPGSKRPDLMQLTASYKELIDYAGPKGISLLIENNGWIRNDPAAIPSVLQSVGEGLSAAPDTGNWTDQARYEGLAKAYPHAVTCDFKAFMFGPGGEHPRYDLRKCFQTGWDAGFRGPWCFEHFDDTLSGLLKGFARLRDLLRAWMMEAK